MVDGTRARLRGAADPLADHPVIAALAAGGLAPGEPDARPADLRELARRGILFERDGLWWHADAIAAASTVVAGLLADDAGGFTVSEFREAAGITRKHAVPLLSRARRPGHHPPSRRPAHRRPAPHELGGIRAGNRDESRPEPG